MKSSDFRFRRSMRLPGYDYTQPGPYFITFCVSRRQCLLGEVVEGNLQPSAAGSIVQSVWTDLSNRHPGLRLDEFIIMPNHVHAILHLPGGTRGEPRGIALGTAVRTLKGLSARLIHKSGLTTFCWQTDYWDHIVRHGEELQSIRDYIRMNPQCWKSDEDFVL